MVMELNASFIPVVDGKVLMLKRNVLNCWEFPGGGVEFGEHPKEAAVRELFEETNLKPKDIKFIDITSAVYEKDGKQKHSIYIIYGGEVEGNIDTSNNEYKEHKEWKLFSLEELSNIRICYNARVELEKIKQLIKH